MIINFGCADVNTCSSSKESASRHSQPVETHIGFYAAIPVDDLRESEREKEGERESVCVCERERQ